LTRQAGHAAQRTSDITRSAFSILAQGCTRTSNRSPGNYAGEAGRRSGERTLQRTPADGRYRWGGLRGKAPDVTRSRGECSPDVAENAFQVVFILFGRAGTEHAFHQRFDLLGRQNGILGCKNLFQVRIRIVTVPGWGRVGRHGD
jgi:hypothetical protein